MSFNQKLGEEDDLAEELGFSSALFIDIPKWNNMVNSDKIANGAISSGSTPDQIKLLDSNKSFINNLLSQDLIKKLEAESPFRVTYIEDDFDKCSKKNIFQKENQFFTNEDYLEDELEIEDSETKASKLSKSSKESKEEEISFSIDKNIKRKYNSINYGKKANEGKFSSIFTKNFEKSFNIHTDDKESKINNKESDNDLDIFEHQKYIKSNSCDNPYYNKDNKLRHKSNCVTIIKTTNNITDANIINSFCLIPKDNNKKEYELDQTFNDSSLKQKEAIKNKLLKNMRENHFANYYNDNSEKKISFFEKENQKELNMKILNSDKTEMYEKHIEMLKTLDYNNEENNFYNFDNNINKNINNLKCIGNINNSNFFPSGCMSYNFMNSNFSKLNPSNPINNYFNYNKFIAMNLLSQNDSNTNSNNNANQLQPHIFTSKNNNKCTGENVKTKSEDNDSASADKRDAKRDFPLGGSSNNIQNTYNENLCVEGFGKNSLNSRFNNYMNIFSNKFFLEDKCNKNKILPHLLTHLNNNNRNINNNIIFPDNKHLKENQNRKKIQNAQGNKFQSGQNQTINQHFEEKRKNLEQKNFLNIFDNQNNDENNKCNKFNNNYLNSKSKIHSNNKNENNQKKKKKPFIEREGDWVCIQCKNLNFSFRINCNRCQISKEENHLLINKQNERINMNLNFNNMNMNFSKISMNMNNNFVKLTEPST